MTRRPPTKPKPKLRKRKARALVVTHDGQTMNVDAELLQMFGDTAPATLAEICEDIGGGRPGHATILADDLKLEMVRLPETVRGQAVSLCNTWITTNANGTAGQLRDLLGLQPEPPAEPAGIIQEAIIQQTLAAAGEAETIARRDELIQAAVRHLARLNNPLAVDRWKKQFQLAGVSATSLQTLLNQVQADDDGDPIRTLITQAVEGTEPEAAMRNLFEALAKLSPFELLRYRVQVQERLKLTATDFDRMLLQMRKLGGRADIVDGHLAYQRELLCNWSGRITHQLTLDDGQNAPRVRYSIEAKLADGKPLPAVDIDAEEFEEVKKWVPRNWGADAIPLVAPSQMYRISTAIKELSRAAGIKRETVYTFTGWTAIEGNPAYLTASGAITKDGLNPNIRVDLGANRLGLYRLPAPPDKAGLKEAFELSFKFLYLSRMTITAPLWCAMYGAPLMPAFGLNAVLWPYGPTQSGKSTIAMLALAHFGAEFIRGRDYQAPKDWLSTITDLEHAMFVTKDLPLVIDDYAPQFNLAESKDMRKKAHQVVRSVGNRSSRGRSNVDLTERAQRPPRGLVISTAELPLDVQSVVGRMVYVPIERGDIFGGKGTELDDHQRLAGPQHGLYARAMAGFIQWLASDRERIFAEARTDHELANQYARTVFTNSQSRMMDYYASLLTYGRTALRFGVAADVLTSKIAQHIGQEVLPAALGELLKAQQSRVYSQSPVVKMFEALADLLVTGRARLERRLGEASSPLPGQTLIGFWDSKDEKTGKPAIYLLTGECLSLARDYWQRAGGSLDTTVDALQREIKQGGMLAYSADGENSVKVWVTSMRKQIRVLALDANEAHVKTGVDLWPNEPEDTLQQDDS